MEAQELGQSFLPLGKSLTFLSPTRTPTTLVIFRVSETGFRGRIWATRGTMELAEIVLRDAGHLQLQDAKFAKRGYSKHEELCHFSRQMT